MWSTEFSTVPRICGPGLGNSSAVPIESVDSVYVLHWFEHCVECAAPDCFRQCRLYVERSDGKCARLRQGMVPDYSYSGLFEYGVNVQFRRWAKIETQLWYGVADPQKARRIAATDIAVTQVVKKASVLLNPIHLYGNAVAAFTKARRIMLQQAAESPARRDFEPDEFLIELWNLGEAFDLTIEAFEDEELRCRCALHIVPGHNLYRIAYPALNVSLHTGLGRILARPANDAEAHVVFTWMDLVRYRQRPVEIDAPQESRPADKVKCVVWDLDETLWTGTLVENGPDGVTVRPEAIELIRELDERGVLQSVASKNDYKTAWGLIEKKGLGDYFLYPAISWGRKSEGIKQIARELNLGLDSFALIDDSPHERSEVQSAIPNLRVFNESQLANVLQKSEFDVPVTQESKLRRQMYLQEVRRKAMSTQFAGDHEDFLRSCDVRAALFPPVSDADRERCLELLQRSNQMNLRTHRYEGGELESFLARSHVFAVAVRCSDKFGEYGIVAFASLVLEDVALLHDFVISCRVAGKKVENAFFQCVSDMLRQLGYSALQAVFVPTARNARLLAVMLEVGFTEIRSDGDKRVLQLHLDQAVAASDVVRVYDQGVLAAMQERLSQQQHDVA